MGYGQNNQNQERQAFSLLELNNRVKGVVLNAFPETCVRMQHLGIVIWSLSKRTR